MQLLNVRDFLFPHISLAYHLNWNLTFSIVTFRYRLSEQMDIRQWLGDTESPQAQHPSDIATSFAQRHGKRQRDDSYDSSLIEPVREGGPVSQKVRHASTSYDPDTESTSAHADRTSSHSHYLFARHLSSSPSPYARRARRPTRPGKYESGPHKEPRRGTPKSNKKRKRKSERKKRPAPDGAQRLTRSPRNGKIRSHRLTVS